MNIRYIAVIVLFIASLIGAKAQNNISVDYTEESELVSVIAHLAKVPGYVWPEEQAGEAGLWLSCTAFHGATPEVEKWQATL